MRLPAHPDLPSVVLELVEAGVEVSGWGMRSRGCRRCAERQRGATGWNASTSPGESASPRRADAAMRSAADFAIPYRGFVLIRV